MPQSSRGSRGPVVFALALLGLTGVAAWQVWLIPSPPAFTAVGPSVMPAAAVGLLGALALGYLVQGLRGSNPDLRDDPEEGALPRSGQRSVWLLGGLAAMLVLLPFVGVGAAGIVSFVLVAQSFESRRPLRDLLVAALVSFALWYLFDQLLGVKLGPFAKLPG